MHKVKAKKHLGQHFLTDLDIARAIAEGLQVTEATKVLEVGPGMGVLTQFLVNNPKIDLSVVEIDEESVVYLKEHFKNPELKIIEADFLRYNLDQFSDTPFSIIGNFPYNISSQIYFKVLEYKDKIPVVVGMLQKEVAERLASGPGSKEYGILSVLLQAYYDIEYLFTVHENVFSPPPKVKSGVIRMKRNQVKQLDCNEVLFKQIIKMGFNQRRKMLSNSLKPLLNGMDTSAHIFTRRPEQLSVAQFIELTNIVTAHRLTLGQPVIDPSIAPLNEADLGL